MRRVPILFLLLTIGVAKAQTSLDSCQRAAQAHYPLAAQYGLIERSEAYTIKNAAKAWVPQLSVSGQATYQSEATSINNPIINISMPKDQYRVGLELNQAIWDGGAVRAQKEIARAGAQVDRRQTDAQLYALNQRVNQLFFGVLSLDEQLRVNTLLDEELARNAGNIRAYIASGVATSADLDAVSVEQLDNAQRRVAIETSRSAYMAMLSALVAFELQSLQRPAEIAIDQTVENRRPELALFDAQNSALETQKRAISATTMPRIGAFAQGAFGNMGYDMFRTNFRPFGIAGIKLGWNIGGFYTSKNEKAKLDVAKEGVEVQRNLFLFNTSLDLKQNTAEIERIRAQMADDDKIIALRENICRAAEARVAGGTMTTTEMLRETTAKNAAIQNKALHSVELLAALYQMKYQTNNE